MFFGSWYILCYYVCLLNKRTIISIGISQQLMAKWTRKEINRHFQGGK